MTEQAHSKLPAQHSPGPWAFDGPPHNIHIFQERNPMMRVCFLTSDGPTEANGRLIAAAPLMLEALKKARICVHEWSPNPTEPLEEIDAAIQSAERP